MPPTLSIIRQRQWRQAQARRGTQRNARVLAGFGLSLSAAGLLAVAVGLGVLAGIYSYYTRDLPPAEALQAAFDPSSGDFFQTTRIYDRTGQHVIYEVIDPRGGDRQYVTYNQIPTACVSATVAIEDKTFFTNPGYDLVGITRALVSNLRGEAIQGGSSITQQLVKNTLIPVEQRALRSYDRKAREVLLAAEITRRYSKEQILEWYLNTNFYGNLAYGLDSAGLVYFGKHAPDLTLAECAMLAAVPNAFVYNPADAPEEAKQRQEKVLEVMVAEGFLPAAEADAAKAQVIVVQPPVKRFDVTAPHFSVYVRRELARVLGEDMVNRGGLKVITTLDLDLQNQAECVARTQVAHLSGGDPNAVTLAENNLACEAAQFLPAMKEADVGVDHHVTNAAVVVLNSQTGEILAMVGSLDYWNTALSGNFNIAADGLRQPGSAFKPFTYLEAFRLGAYAPASMVLDIPVEYPQADGSVYAPENYDRKFHGAVSMRVALARSYNIPAVETINRVGVDNVIRLTHRLGLNTLELGQYGLALTLGGGEVTLLDLTYAYSVFANAGVMAGQPVDPSDQRPGYRQLDPIAILRVEDSQGNSVYPQVELPQTQPILSPELAYLLNNVLSDNDARAAAFGRESALYLPERPAAAKTGTTNDFRDNWTMGYTPQLAVGVWVGNADNTPMQSVTGLTGAAPIWHAVLEYASQTLPVADWTAPASIVRVVVCEPSGLLPTPQCPQTREEIFIAGTEPNAPDNLWQTVGVNRETGKRATVCTPPELVEEKVYEILPPEADAWVRENNLPQPPMEYDALGSSCVASGQAAIDTPRPFDYIRGTVDIVGTSTGDDTYNYFWVDYGAGLNPQTWTKIEGNRGEKIEHGVLQVWNTAGLDGLYTVRLVIVKNDPNGGPFQFEHATVQVTVDNQSPIVALVAPAEGETFSAQTDEFVVLQAQAQDNLSLARVEFYVDEALVDVSLAPPYSTRWSIKSVRSGSHTVLARVYDAAGNTSESAPVTVQIR